MPRRPSPALRLAAGVACCLLWGGGTCNPGGSSRTNVALPVDAVESYDPASDTWQARASFAPRHTVAVTATIGSRLVAVAAVSTEVSAYDPASDAWSALAPFPSPGRLGFGAAAVQGLWLVAGGNDGVGAVARVDVYDPLADQWRTGSAMPAAFDFTQRFAATGDALHVLAQTFPFPNGPPPPADHAAYDPLLDRWEVLPPLPRPRFAGTWTSDGAQLYLIGGQLSATGSGQSTVDRYDPVTRTWTAGPDLALPEVQPVVLPIGPGDLLLVGEHGAQRLGPGGWRVVASPQALRVSGPGVRLGDRLYAYAQLSGAEGQPISFDLTQEVWRRHPRPPTHRVFPHQFAFQGELYTALGVRGVRLDLGGPR